MKFLAVCGFGVGSSMVLKMTLDKVIKELGIDAVAENTDVTSAQATKADAIFTNEEMVGNLRNSVDIPIYPIKKYMDKDEVMEQVKKFLEEKNNK